MKKTISHSECHGILLNIATAFHNICVAHNIPYYMLGGTQLGAVRHRGMIPWDDDMDFGVPREYFEQLKHILLTELQPSYNVISIDSTTQYYGGFIKIEDSNTVVDTLEDCSFPLGLNIDIFPLDRTNGSSPSLLQKPCPTAGSIPATSAESTRTVSCILLAEKRI